MSRSVTPDYFRAFNIPSVCGQDFTDQDRTGNESEVILSRSLAARLFLDEHPVGERIQTGGVTPRCLVQSRRRGRQREEQWTHGTSGSEIYFVRRIVGGDWDRKSYAAMLLLSTT
jgi:putative ABC transport system permease protein